MSVAEPKTTDWEAFLRHYGRDRGETLGDVARWLSSLPSLAVGCELLGAHTYEASSLGHWLDKHGYPVPPLTSAKDYFLGANGDKGRAKSDDKETFTVLDDVNRTFTLQEIRLFERMWRDGISVEHIAQALNRDADEIVILAIDRARKRKIRGRERGLVGT